ncbi:hypothetical protein [Streptomyces luteocolor]|uniref:hypothetical protein n=1 Tax=Streptomyces luteocolor TaxID=285500 RepID=UPI000852FB96|nr:hypothetical protein [Streptomyces luteocolor]
MRTARSLCGSAAGLGTAAALVLVSAPQAVSGGPTSVLLVAPESTRSASLYNNDVKYDQLERWLEPAGTGEPPDKTPPGLGIGEDSRQINITWMVHDVRPWRVDRVYPPLPARKGADVWVHRSTDTESLNGDWYRAKEPERLVSLFKKLGLMGKASVEGSSGVPPETGEYPPPTASEESADAQAGAAGGGGPGSDGTDWWWAIPGAGAGAVAALLLRRPVTEGWATTVAWRRRPRETGPRQELRDL